MPAALHWRGNFFRRLHSRATVFVCAANNCWTLHASSADVAPGLRDNCHMHETIHSLTTLPPPSLLTRLGRQMRKHQRIIGVSQWLVVSLYAFFLLAPLFLPPPDTDARILSHLRLFAHFLFWGIGWPFIMLSMMLFGRVWCGIFCPDGTLTEYVSKHGRKQSIPRWIRWPGWPFAMLVLSTVYGQLVGLYELHLATLLLLGLPTIGAIWCGYAYGNGKRIWCMYLCPANGVFSLLAKISPLHFHVDEDRWKQHPLPLPRVDCAPLIDIRRMKSASACHACGRCSGYLNAVELATRTPDSEILATPKQQVRTVEAITLIFGLLGVCTAAVSWAGSKWFASLKALLLNSFLASMERHVAPWWLLANHPYENKVYTLLDGLGILLYILGGGALLGMAILTAIWLAEKVAAKPDLSWQRLALALIPIAGVGIFLGLSSYTLTYLQHDGFSMAWAAYFQAALLAIGSVFSIWLGAKMIYAQHSLRNLLALVIFLLPIALMCFIWAAKYFG